MLLHLMLTEMQFSLSLSLFALSIVNRYFEMKMLPQLLS